ncbi:MAG: cobalt-precorrin-6A reductase [Calothrix sp. MO_192.B10]|nr:cobalt-precorrin-6A reductase [Calothrix sp. MO_192.B10]
MGRIWLIGGTKESANLALAIVQEQIPCIVTVTTKSAESLYPDVDSLQVWVGRLSVDKLGEFCQQQQIVAILDASHPYAVEISQIAIALSQEYHLPYLRYERPTVESGADRGVIYLDSFETLLGGDYLTNHRVLLTVGYRPLQMFQTWQNRATLFARLLPSTTALEAALQAGFTPDRLICLRPPISADLETALWRHWQISLVVTKASGTAGGEDIKGMVAAQLGIPLIVINRPLVNYPQQTSDVSAAIEFCQQASLEGKSN